MYNLLQDFEHFPDQRDFYFGTNKYINEMLISIKGEKWKTMRTMASPVFTSGKLKGMVPLIESVRASCKLFLLKHFCGLI